jgi:hypothetical protein
MNQFNYDSYMKNNPLLKETDGYGSYKNPEKMLEDQDPYTYQSAEEFDLEPQDGPNDPLGPDEELMEGEGKVLEVYQLCIDAMRSYIKKYGLDDEDVQQLREKLAKFYS